MNDEPKTCSNCFFHEYDENGDILCIYHGETVSEDDDCPKHTPETCK
jgi:hypothetical protein